MKQRFETNIKVKEARLTVGIGMKIITSWRAQWEIDIIGYGELWQSGEKQKCWKLHDGAAERGNQTICQKPHKLDLKRKV